MRLRSPLPCTFVAPNLPPTYRDRYSHSQSRNTTEITRHHGWHRIWCQRLPPSSIYLVKIFSSPNAIPRWEKRMRLYVISVDLIRKRWRTWEKIWWSAPLIFYTTKYWMPECVRPIAGREGWCSYHWIGEGGRVKPSLEVWDIHGKKGRKKGQGRYESCALEMDGVSWEIGMSVGRPVEICACGLRSRRSKYHIDT